MPTHKWRTNVWGQWKGAPPPTPVAPEISREWAEWNGWLTMACLARQIVVARNPDGRLELFAVTFTYELSHRWQVAPNSPWGGFARMPGVVTGLAIALGADNNINLFAIGRNKEILCNRKAAGWTGWQSMGGAAAHVALGKHADGRLDIFAIAPDNKLAHACQTAPDGAWGRWATIPAAPVDSF